MSGLIDTILFYMGITAPPTSVAELVWFLLRVTIGLVVIKLTLGWLFSIIAKVGKW